MKRDNFLFIGDVHIPFEHENYLNFCKSLQKDFDVPHENVYSVGDLTDQYHFSRYPKSPNALHTADQEIDMGREKLRKWAKAFPELKLCESNHDSRIIKLATGAQLPSQVIKSFREIFEVPDQWQIKQEFVICGPNIMVCHGEEYVDALLGAVAYGVNLVQGHHHSKFGVRWRRTRMQELWGAATGWGGDAVQYAFEYGDKCKEKPILGAIVVSNNIPFSIPMK